ncbi:MAG: hypothetical protein V3U87_05420 [Methylococcaceae bacterium]
MDWLVENKDWLFSGIAIAIPLSVLGWIINKRKRSRIQNQKGGDSSTNLQAGGNISYKSVNKDD